MQEQSTDTLPELSLIAPAHNEQDNIEPLVEQVSAALVATGLQFEMVIVDDGSTDDTAQVIRRMMQRHRWVRAVTMLNTPPGKGLGLSAALGAGIAASRGELIAMLDADLQNDPADLPAMIRRLCDENVDMVHGDRSHARRDNFIRRISSWIGRAFRRVVLADAIRDTGCSLRVMKRHVAVQLPLQYRGAHRFIPFYARMIGCKVVEVPVNHRPRVAGRAKYGVLNRALPGLLDLLALRWMKSRHRRIETEPFADKD